MAEESVKRSAGPKVVVATTVALSFISFWRGAAVVLSDLASTMYYVGGIVEQAVGKAAPWFVLMVMLFSFAVRSVYMESCSMFVRGGVYAVVRNSMGNFMARLSVSALIFDYLLTGPISSVSAGHYVSALINRLLEAAGMGLRFDDNITAVIFALAVTLYFWWYNILGVHESSTKALRIMQATSVMLVILLAWGLVTIVLRGAYELPPAPVTANLRFSEESLGWFHGTDYPRVPFIAFFIAFGHSFLSMSGFETLAQVYRELAYPKLRNLRRTGNLVCMYALIGTGLSTLFAVMIIPDHLRAQFKDNLIAGLALNLAGPESLRFIFFAFVVIVGALILAGAVNTSIIGANSVLNRLAEDGVLFSWFRRPHPKFGTTYRLLNVFVVLQLCTIVLSGGDVYLLGEAYAFGVVWSFFLKSCGVLALRYQRHDQEYKVPFNLHIRGIEIPIGLGFTTLVLFCLAMTNLFSKQYATIYGVSFTILLFIVFTVAERVNRARHLRAGFHLEQFNLEQQPEIATEALNVKPGGMLVAVRDYNSLTHLKWVLDRTARGKRDITVVTVRLDSAGEGEYGLTAEQYFSDYERELFTRVVQMAEKEGKHVDLLVVPGGNPFDALVQAAAKLQVAYLVTGVSPRMSADELARQIGRSWEDLPEPRHPFSLVVMKREGGIHQVSLGPHTPRLWPEDVLRVHSLWLELSDKEEFGSRLHHRDVVSLAIRRLEKELSGEERERAIADLRKVIEEHADAGAADSTIGIAVKPPPA